MYTRNTPWATSPSWWPRSRRPKSAARYGTATADEFLDGLGARPPDVVLHTIDLGLNAPFIRYAQTHGFRQVAPPDARYQMWVRPEAGGGRAD